MWVKHKDKRDKAMDEMSNEPIVTRQMPSDRVAEESVIGAMIFSKDAIDQVEGILVKEDFYYEQFGAMFEAILKLNEQGLAVDPTTLQSKLREMNVPEEFGSVEYLMNLTSQITSSANAGDYAKIVKNKSLLRRIIRTNQSIEKKCYEQKESVEMILDDTERDFLELLQEHGAEKTKSMQQIVDNVIGKIQEANRSESNITGIPTGFIDLDDRLCGLQKSDLLLIAARPSMGKTALALNIAQHVAFHEHKTTAIFSLEMSAEQLAMRLLSLESGLKQQNMRTGQLEEEDWSALMMGADTLSGSPLLIDDTSGITVSEMRSKCRKYKQENNLELVIIDYLQLMSGSGRAESRQNEVSEISRSLKSLARELDVPIIALSQLSRKPEERENKRPILSDLRDSGAIEQDADVVMFIYRDDYYNHDSPDKGISEIIIAKQRNGPLGTVPLVWIPETTQFHNAGRRPHDQQD